MKFGRDENILRLSGVAVLLIVTSGIMLVFTPDYSYFGISFALLLVGIAAAVTPEEYLIQDERSARIDEKVGYHAFVILLLAMALLQSIGRIWRLNFSFKAVIPDLFLVGIWSWIVLKWYYNRRGYVQ